MCIKEFLLNQIGNTFAQIVGTYTEAGPCFDSSRHHRDTTSPWFTPFFPSSGEDPAGHRSPSPFVKLCFLSVPLLGPGGACVYCSGDGSMELLLLLQGPSVYGGL